MDRDGENVRKGNPKTFIFCYAGIKIILKFIKKLVLAWDPDYTKVTPAERKALEEAEKDIAENGTISHDAINWD